mmetsp:Transcript_19685/g.29813  ORF Transcript_19685/g.29813 Transcript_19685/m.29813 type:complete len:479 (+) Transcript_19685:110-1546(+)
MPPEMIPNQYLATSFGTRQRSHQPRQSSQTGMGTNDYHDTGIKTESELLLFSNRNGSKSDIAEDDFVANATIPSADNSVTEVKHLLVLGVDLSGLSRKRQFLTCAGGVFGFSLLYGYLQELISVKLCDRQLGLFIAVMQFMGYAVWSKILNYHVKKKLAAKSIRENNSFSQQKMEVPVRYYILLSVLRAIDASMTNMAMAYLNYPAKTLMKSSRVVFTMLFGTLLGRKRYNATDYFVVLLMVTGLAIFMHADSRSSAVFQPLGIGMLTISLMCDGAIINMSEKIMKEYNVGQDEFIYKLYSIALVGIVGAAAVRGDLVEGSKYLLTPGTYGEILRGEDTTWSVKGKIFAIFLFASTGFFGSSCSALITKEFGALTMSITSTARKATTLFLSFALFNNVCTKEHVGGIALFIWALVAKSFRASRKGLGNSAMSRSNVNAYSRSQSGDKKQLIELEVMSSQSRDAGGMKRRTKRHGANIV